MTLDDLTPTEWLILEVLQARHRLGDTLWPFPKQMKPALRSLETKGYIGYQGGPVSGTRNAWLDDRPGQPGAKYTRPRGLDDDDKPDIQFMVRAAGALAVFSPPPPVGHNVLSHDDIDDLIRGLQQLKAITDP